MDTILDALQEGRLFELPESDKNRSLQFLAHIIEAFPQIPAGTDVVGSVLARESAGNTALEKGWACPHARLDIEEDLMCVIGWSPSGIDYAAPDGKPVSIIVMYLVPTNQRNHYLREISLLARVLQNTTETDRLPVIRDLNEVRNFLLDMITAGKEAAGPDARARMIRLQARAAQPALPLADLANVVVEALSIVTAPGQKPFVLTQNNELMAWIESLSGLAERLETEGGYHNDTWRLIRRGVTVYQGGRCLYDCIAIAPAKRLKAERADK